MYPPPPPTPFPYPTLFRSHRNVTPKNILFRAADNHIKLADMGLAKALSGSALRQFSMRTKIPEELPYMAPEQTQPNANLDRKSTRLNSSHLGISYAVFCLK